MIQLRKVTISLLESMYLYLARPILFLTDSEFIHEFVTSFGESLGKSPKIRKGISFITHFDDPRLRQTIAGINFNNPVGLAAGFDYEAKLTQLVPSLNFGFATIGTITNLPYEGNPKPRLGRLPKSRSTMVNKGFKNIGARKIIEKLEKYRFDIPLGISIGRTNSPKLKTVKDGIADIVSAFTLFEKSKLRHSYYELNISCPNLLGTISFYAPKDLNALLAAIDKLHVKRPNFIKMPIENSDKETLAMLKVIVKFKSIKGVIFGNLQKDRKDLSLDSTEVKKFPVGNFSGKPTEKRSNELIRLAYKKYGKKLVIIGCGGIFNGEDAYKKIRLGASLVQLITGMIFQGPQLPAQINLNLPCLLEKDGFKHLSEAIGTQV